MYDVHVPLTRRTQVLLDDKRYEFLRRRADASGSSVGALIREAIDRVYLDEAAEREARLDAGASFLAAEPRDVGDWERIERELDRARSRGLNHGAEA